MSERGNPGVAGRSFKQFATLPSIDGFDVICADTGRPVDHRDTLKEATGVAYYLNQVAAEGNIATVLGRR